MIQKEINRMKIIGTFLLLVLATLLQTACLKEKAEEKSYKATTVEECVQEKECVGNIFALRATRILSRLNREMGNSTLHKWSRPIRLDLKGDPKWISKYRSVVQAKVDQIEHYTPLEIEFNETENFVIVFSKDFKRDIEVTYRDEFYKGLLQILGEERLENLLNKVDDCFVFTLTNPAYDPNDIRAVLSFVNPTKKPERCIKEHFLTGVGLNTTLEKFSGNFKTDNPNDFTKLDLFMLSLLYHPEMKQGLSLVKINYLFDAIHDQELEKFNLKYRETHNE